MRNLKSFRVLPLSLAALLAYVLDYFLPHPQAYLATGLEPILISLAVSAATTAASTGLQYLVASRQKVPNVDRGKMDDIRIFTAGYGEFIPKGWGIFRVAPIVFWGTPIVHSTITTQGTGGGKGSPKPPTPGTIDHIYTKTFAAVFHDGQLFKGASRIWFDTDLVYNGGNGNTGTPSGGGGVPTLPPRKYEGEFGVLAGGASVVNQTGCSGGKKVTGIGLGGTCTMTVTAPAAGTYDLAVHYTANTIRTFKVSVNGGATQDLVCASTGGPGVVGIKTLTPVTFTLGTNTIVFSNAAAVAPDLDYIDFIKVEHGSGGGGGEGDGGATCFVAGTPITLFLGQKKAIELIAQGDKVRSFDPETGNYFLGQVTDRIVRDAKDFYTLEFADGSKRSVTGEHPFYVHGSEGPRIHKHFVCVVDLKKGDEVYVDKGQPTPIQIKSIEHVTQPVQVFNFNVWPHHTYIAGDALVHNVKPAYTGTVDVQKIAPDDQDASWPYYNYQPEMDSLGTVSTNLAKYGQPKIRLYSGTSTQIADPAIVADKGAANTSAHRGFGYLVIEGLQLPNGRLPNVTVECNQGVHSVPSIVEDIYELVGVSASSLNLTALNGLMLGTSTIDAGTYVVPTYQNVTNATVGSGGGDYKDKRGRAYMGRLRHFYGKRGIWGEWGSPIYRRGRSGPDRILHFR